MIELTAEMVNAYETAASETAEHSVYGYATGLAAVLAIVERDYDVTERVQTRCGALGFDGITCQRSPDHDGHHAANVLNQLVKW